MTRSNTAQWSSEVRQLGTREAILDRLRFHGGMYLSDIVTGTGRCQSTVLHHLDKLLAEGLIQYDGDSHYKFKVKE